MTDLTSAAAATAIVDGYLTAYGEPDRGRRDALIAEVWSPHGRLIDPPVTGAGHDGISDVADALQQQFAGHVFRRSTGVDEHHGVLRFGWELVAPDGGIVLTGLDVGELDDEGRLLRIAGFFGDLPAREAS